MLNVPQLSTALVTVTKPNKAAALLPTRTSLVAVTLLLAPRPPILTELFEAPLLLSIIRKLENKEAPLETVRLLLIFAPPPTTIVPLLLQTEPASEIIATLFEPPLPEPTVPVFETNLPPLVTIN